MSTLSGLISKAEKIQKEIEAIKTRDRSKVMQEITQQMSSFGISLKDLQEYVKIPTALSGQVEIASKGKMKGAKKTKAQSTVPPKFRGPGGELWTGRGMMPKWMRAMIDVGRTKEEFAIERTPNSASNPDSIPGKTSVEAWIQQQPQS